MHEEIYYYIPEKRKEPFLLVIQKLNGRVVFYTKNQGHWLYNQNYETIQLNTIFDLIERAFEQDKSLEEFKMRFQSLYSQENWRSNYLKRLLDSKLHRNFSKIDIVETIDEKHDRYYLALLANLSSTGFPEGLSKIEDPEVYFDDEEAVKVVPENEVKVVEESRTIIFPIEVEDLFKQIQENDDLYELFTDYKFQQEIIAYLKDRHRDEIIDFAKNYDPEQVNESIEDFIYQELMPEKNQDIFNGLQDEAEELMLSVLEDNLTDVAEEIEVKPELPLDELFSVLKAHEYFSEFKEDYEFEIERLLYDKYKSKVEYFLKENFNDEINNSIDDLVFEEMIYDFWDKLFRELSDLLMNAMKQVITDNLREVKQMLD